MTEIALTTDIRGIYEQALAPATPAPARPEDFGRALQTSINNLNQLRHERDQSVEDLISGRSQDLHGTMILMEKSSVSMQLALQIRNKLLETYNEILKMNV